MGSPADIQEQMRAAWNGRDFNTMRGLLHIGFAYTGPDGKEIAGPELAIAIAKTFTTAFPDALMENKRLFTDGGTIIAETVVAGTHLGQFMGIAPTGRRAELHICNIMEIRGDKVCRMREYFDMLAFMMQLGVTRMPRGAWASASAGL
jgi:ketosteroid isomerase-like protein